MPNSVDGIATNVVAQSDLEKATSTTQGNASPMELLANVADADLLGMLISLRTLMRVSIDKSNSEDGIQAGTSSKLHYD